MTSFRSILRVLGTALLLFLAWNRLSLWYEFLHPADYGAFAICFAAAAVLGLAPEIRSLLLGVSRARLTLAAGILALALPWGEWLRLALPSAREDWTRRLFLEICLLYGSWLLLRAVRPLRLPLKEAALASLDRASSKKPFLVIVPLFFFCFVSWIVFVAYQRIFVIQDAAASIFQAAIFRSGHLYAPAPPVPEAFSSMGDMLVLRDGKWYSVYLPGFSLLLAGFMAVHLESFLCPAFGAGTIALWMLYIRRWHDRRTALLTGILCLTSPMFFLMHSSNMVHTAELFFASLALYLCRWESENSSKWRLCLLGVALLAGVVTRGFSFLPFMAPALAFTAWKRLGRGFSRFAVVTGVAVLCGMTIVALYQWKTTGSPWLAAYDLEYDHPIPFGFHGEVVGQMHTPLRGLENVSNNLLGMDSWLTGWKTGCLFFLILFLLLQKKFDSWDKVLIFCCLALAGFYYFIVFQDLVRGPRYWFLMVPILSMFVARGILVDDVRVRPYATSIAFVAFAGYLLFQLPAYVRQYSPQKTQAGQLRAAIDNAGNGKTLVLLDRHVTQQFVNWNDPFLRGDSIICSDLGAGNARLFAAFPGYRVLYFRESQSMKKSSLTSGFRLLDTPDPNPTGYLSLFNFALIIQSANEYRDQDLFDLSYAQFLSGDAAANNLRFLAAQERESVSGPNLRLTLKNGLLHAARMVLLPKQAYETGKKNWKQNFDIDSFRSEMESAAEEFQKAGDTGVILLLQITKIERRIDVNGDGRYSDDEIVRFLSQKMRILELG